MIAFENAAFCFFNFSTDDKNELPEWPDELKKNEPQNDSATKCGYVRFEAEQGMDVSISSCIVLRKLCSG